MTISFGGLASGLDTTSWINALTSLKRAKVTTLQEKQEVIGIQRDTLSSVKSFFSSFRTTIEKLTDANFGISTMDLFVQNLATSTDASKLTAVADTSAEEKTYKIKIDRVASNTEAKSGYTLGSVSVGNATNDSVLNTLSIGEGSGTINSGNIQVLINGVSRSVSIDADETMGSFISKLNDIGVDAFYDAASGKVNMNVSLSDIDEGNTNIKSALHLAGVNEGYYTNKLQYRNAVTNTAVATRDTKLGSLGSGVAFGNKDGEGYESISVTNSSGETSIIKVNENTTIGELADSLNNAGFFASLSKNGVFELSGGVINDGGTFDIASVFGLSQTSGSAMVICNPLTTVIENPDVVTLDTRLVEDLGITRGYFEVSTDNGDSYYKKIYSGMTMADLVSELGNLGVTATLDNANGTLTLSGGSLAQLTDEDVTALINNTTIQENDNGLKKASNFLTSAGYVDGSSTINFNNVYTYNGIEPPAPTIGAITSDTKLADIITEGEGYNRGFVTVVKDGVQYNLSLGENDTFKSLMDTLSIHGFDSVINDQGELIIQTDGDSRIQAYSTPESASNILDILGANSSDWIVSNMYTSNALNVITTEDEYIDATRDTVLSDIYRVSTTDDETFELTNESLFTSLNGGLELVIDGVVNSINVTENDTIGSLLDKFSTFGLDASISNGKILINSGYKTLSVNASETDGSALVTSGLLKYNSDGGGYVSSSSAVISTVDETEDLSAAGWADGGTKLKALNITTGTLSVYRDGSKASVTITQDETFSSLQDKINNAFVSKYGSEYGDIEISFEHGYMTMKSASGVEVTSGASTDSSNFSSITGSYSAGDGSVRSSRELYKVNVSSNVTEAGLFRAGNITEGNFIVGDQVITIDSTTTLGDIISEINSNNSSVSAYWDTMSGQLVLRSTHSGSMFVNVEAGTSNFTDVLGLTNSTRDGDNNIINTTLNTEAQNLGANAIFYINGTMYTSNSNTVGSDISRIEGVTLNLKNATKGETLTLSIEADTETVSNALEDVVMSYNDLMSAVDMVIASDGALADQTALKMIRNQIKNYMTSSLSGSTVFRNLDAIGVSVDSASATNIATSNAAITNLTFDKQKFADAYMTDGAALKKLLVGDGVNDGVLNKIEKLLENSLQGVTGYFDAQVASYNNQIRRLGEQVTKANREVTSYQAMLENKFSTMDMLIQNIQQQYSSFLS